MRECLKGLEDFKCYDEFWLYKDMENMGYLFEFCNQYCKELFHINYRIDEKKLISSFMKSDLRALMEIGHPKLLSQAAQDTLEDFIKIDCDGNIEQFKTVGKHVEYKHLQLYWVGWIYAYIHYQSKQPSKIIIEKLPVQEVLRDYKLGHEMDKEVYYDKIKWVFND